MLLNGAHPQHVYDSTARPKLSMFAGGDRTEEPTLAGPVRAPSGTVSGTPHGGPQGVFSEVSVMTDWDPIDERSIFWSTTTASQEAFLVYCHLH